MAKSKRVGILNLNEAISQVLGEYGNDVYRVLGVATKEVAEEASRKLMAGGSYKGGAAYNRDWTYGYESTKKYNQGYIVYNVEHYRLAHLLEFGHALKTGTGRVVGHTRAFPHIKPVEDWAIQELPKRIEVMLK